MRLVAFVSCTSALGVVPPAPRCHRRRPPPPFPFLRRRPAFTVDVALVTSADPPQLLLIQRKHDPFAGAWALPGGFVDEGEPLAAAAARELQEETSVDPAGVSLVQVGAFGDPGRDPRGWTVTAAYAALVPSSELGVRAADDAADAKVGRGAERGWYSRGKSALLFKPGGWDVSRPNSKFINKGVKALNVQPKRSLACCPAVVPAVRGAAAPGV